jgi:hypothetical protein
MNSPYLISHISNLKKGTISFSKVVKKPKLWNANVFVKDDNKTDNNNGRWSPCGTVGATEELMASQKVINAPWVGRPNQ